MDRYLSVRDNLHFILRQLRRYEWFRQQQTKKVGQGWRQIEQVSDQFVVLCERALELGHPGLELDHITFGIYDWRFHGDHLTILKQSCQVEVVTLKSYSTGFNSP